jgi:hypothetical protein
MLNNPQVKYRIIMLLAFMLLLALACNLPNQSSQPEVTIDVLAQSIASTQTAETVEEHSSNDLATAQAAATQTSQNIQATQVVAASTKDIDQKATTTAEAPVLAALPFYNLDANQGNVGWVHPPAKIELQGKNQYGYANDFMQTIVEDFAMSADVTWDTQYGASGCGFMFRSDGDKNKPNQYMLIASRLGNGHVIFSALADGEMANVHDFYPRDSDKSFNAENGSTNRITVVGKGNIFEIYTNGVKIGEVDTTQPPSMPKLPAKPALPTDQNIPSEMDKYRKQLEEYQDMVSQVNTNYGIALNNYKKTSAVFDKGFVAMIGVSESGKTMCQFDNAWLWLIEK